jgi:hypothetical protein
MQIPEFLDKSLTFAQTELEDEQKQASQLGDLPQDLQSHAVPFY